MTHGGLHDDPLYENVQLPRDLAIGGATGVAIWLGAEAFKKFGPRLGFGSLGLGAAANAVSMAIGLPVLAGYGISYAIGGKQGMDDFEFFMVRPSSWVLLTIQSAVAVGSHYMSDDTFVEYEDSNVHDPLMAFEGLRHRLDRSSKFPFMA